MEVTKLSEVDLRKEYADFIETDELMIAKNPDKSGAYIAHFKTAAILRKPEDEYERQKMYQAALKDAEKGIAILRAAFGK